MSTSSFHPSAGWALHLANLTTRPGQEPPRSTIELYAGLLARDFPVEAFCIGSLHAAARQFNCWPAYRPLFEVIQKWWRENRAPAALPSPVELTPSQEVARREVELRADWDDADGIRRRMVAIDGDPTLLRLLWSMVRRWAPQHLAVVEEAFHAAELTLPTDEGRAESRVGHA